jgi:hypothetical protein
VSRAGITDSLSGCGKVLSNESLIVRFSSTSRHVIFTNVVRMISNVAPRQRDRCGA